MFTMKLIDVKYRSYASKKDGHMVSGANLYLVNEKASRGNICNQAWFSCTKDVADSLVLGPVNVETDFYGNIVTVESVK